MSTFSVLREGLRVAGAIALTGGVALPAVAGEIYSWRTEDGAYAFTDDHKAIPARYRAVAQSRETADLAGYERLTKPPAGSGDAYAARLAARLERLRALNRDLDARSQRTAEAQGLTSLSIAAGGLNLGVPMNGADGPVIVDKVRFRYNDEMATRHNLVVKQGGKILTVIKGDPLVGPINQAPDVQRMVRE